MSVYESDCEVYLSDVSPKDKQWDVHRASTSAVHKIYKEAGRVKYAKRTHDCSRLLEFKVKTDSEGNRKFKLEAARFCGLRTCPVCQWRKGLGWLGRIIKGLPQLREDHPKLRWVFLTLTVRNCHVTELRETVTMMEKAFSNLSKRKQWPAKGFLKAFEITQAYDCYNGNSFLGRHGAKWVEKWEKQHKGKKLRLEPTGEAHPHFHILMAVQPSYFSTGYISQEKWTELWKSVLNVDYTPIVNIKVVKPKQKEDGTIQTEAEMMASAIRETAKYSLKPQDLTSDPEWLLAITDQLKNKRSVATGGILKKYFGKDDPTDLINTDTEAEELDLTEEEFTTFFAWLNSMKRYVKRY